MNRFPDSNFPFPAPGARRWAAVVFPDRRIVVQAEDPDELPPALAWEQAMTPAPPYRSLLAEPGVERIVRLADFRALLGPQLDRPERLRDAHRLACRVRAFEVTSPLSWSAFAGGLGADVRAACPFAPLTELAVERLELAGLIPPALRARQAGLRRPGELLPHDRIFEIRPVSDPTRVEPAGYSRSRPIENTIPNSPSKPGEFPKSREEAVYDLERDSRGFLRRWGRRLEELLFGRSDFRKWRCLLEGRDADEQLWEVSPPRGRLSSPRVREWARVALERAGYEPRTMLREWEIYWRRKGL